ncbi:hypothetical protein LXL04_017962 [Taraxacum kok-saghyz]
MEEFEKRRVGDCASFGDKDVQRQAAQNLELGHFKVRRGERSRDGKNTHNRWIPDTRIRVDRVNPRVDRGWGWGRIIPGFKKRGRGWGLIYPLGTQNRPRNRPRWIPEFGSIVYTSSLVDSRSNMGQEFRCMFIYYLPKISQLIITIKSFHPKDQKCSHSRSFENSYIPENPRTPKPLTFSKNRLRGAKNRSNISPVAKKFSEKTTFFSPKTLHMCKLFFVCICAQSLYNTYLKRFLHICTKNKKKSCTNAKVKKKYRFFGKIFQRIVMIKNVLEGSEVGFLKGITMLVQMRTIIKFENGGTNLDRYKSHYSTIEEGTTLVIA